MMQGAVNLISRYQVIGDHCVRSSVTVLLNAFAKWKLAIGVGFDILCFWGM